MTANYEKYILNFKRPGGTSRGVLLEKETFILTIEQQGRKGTGECAVFRGLSFDDRPDYEKKLQWLCNNINEDIAILKLELKHFPSIWFGLEQALLNLKWGENLYFPSDFTKGEDPIIINGLIWMGDVGFMQKQIQEKLDEGFQCIKLKIGVNWQAEYQILQTLREQFDHNVLEIRVDANGGFAFQEATKVLEQLAQLQIHSVEQPIKAGNLTQMKTLCENTPTPIALDEELIGVIEYSDKEKLLEEIKPQYIILKPALVGGFSGSNEWISIAEKNNIKWWITSALESNIGLNALAQFTYTKKNTMPQGLGTGNLFVNNFATSLHLDKDALFFIK